MVALTPFSIATPTMVAAIPATIVASMFVVGKGGLVAHAEVTPTTTAARKAITLLNRVAIASYYTQDVGLEWWQF